MCCLALEVAVYVLLVWASGNVGVSGGLCLLLQLAMHVYAWCVCVCVRVVVSYACLCMVCVYACCS